MSETKELKAGHMYMFYEQMKNKYCARSVKGESKLLGDAFVQKVMTHLRTYVRRLNDNSYLSERLTPGDVPRGKVLHKMPTYLTKGELARIMQTLEQLVIDADKSGIKARRYNAYIWRAIVRTLYTTGLRNAELRSLTYDDINLSQLC